MGRILGPRGLTAKQLEAETGCKIMVRGKGSMRDKKKVTHTHTLTQRLLDVVDVIKYTGSGSIDSGIDKVTGANIRVGV